MPERIDLITAMLFTAGLGSLIGASYGVVRGASREQRAVYVERTSLVAASLGLALFLIGVLVQAPN